MMFNRTPAALAGVLFQACVLLLAAPHTASAQEKPPSPEQMAEIHRIMLNAKTPVRSTSCWKRWRATGARK